MTVLPASAASVPPALYLPGEDADNYVPPWERDPGRYYEACRPGPAFYPNVRSGLPVYLSGVNTPGLATLEQAGYDIGLLLQPGNGTRAQAHTYRLWAADNGCFAEASGKPWSAPAWFTWLHGLAADRQLRWGCWGSGYESRTLDPGDSTPTPMGCLFATAPDVVGDPVATWRRSYSWFARIRNLGLPVALVAQDGLERFPNAWDESERWDCLFIGGSTAWKLSTDARDCAREAQSLGKWVHVGRCNSNKRLRLTASWGCDSADGTYLGYGPEKNLPQLRSWLDGLKQTPVRPAPTWRAELLAELAAPAQLQLLEETR